MEGHSSSAILFVIQIRKLKALHTYNISLFNLHYDDTIFKNVSTLIHCDDTIFKNVSTLIHCDDTIFKKFQL